MVLDLVCVCGHGKHVHHEGAKHCYDCACPVYVDKKGKGGRV